MHVNEGINSESKTQNQIEKRILKNIHNNRVSKSSDLETGERVLYF